MSPVGQEAAHEGGVGAHDTGQDRTGGDGGQPPPAMSRCTVSELSSWAALHMNRGAACYWNTFCGK